MAETNFTISKLNINGITYGIKDTVARQATTGGIHYKGTTATELVDGSHEVPSDIYKDGATPAAGDLVIYGNLEFIATVNDSEVTWHEFGSTGSLKALAFKDNATGNFNIASSGTHKHTFAGEPSTSDPVKFHNSGIEVSDHSYTPAGSVTLGSTREAFVTGLNSASTTLKTGSVRGIATTTGHTLATTNVIKTVTLPKQKVTSVNVSTISEVNKSSVGHGNAIATIGTNGLKLVVATINNPTATTSVVTHDTPTLGKTTANKVSGKLINGTEAPVIATISTIDPSTDMNDCLLTLSAVSLTASQEFNYGIGEYGSSLTAGDAQTITQVALNETTVATGAATANGTGAELVSSIDTTTLNNVVTGLTGAEKVVTGVEFETTAVAAYAVDTYFATGDVTTDSETVVNDTNKVVFVEDIDTSDKTFVTGLNDEYSTVVTSVETTDDYHYLVNSATFAGTPTTLDHTVTQGQSSGTVTITPLGIITGDGAHTHSGSVTVS